jgi:hypothetical protein
LGFDLDLDLIGFTEGERPAFELLSAATPAVLQPVWQGRSERCTEDG